jgi:hypothetical protein
MSVAWYGNAPLPPPSPSRDVTPRSHTARLHVDYQPRPPRKAAPAAQSQARRESPPGSRPPANTSMR